MSRIRRALRLILAAGVLSGALATLVGPGQRALPGPPADPGRLDAWLADTPTDAVAGALLRLVAVGLTGWLLVLVVLAVVAVTVDSARALLVLDRWSFGLVRRVMVPAVGVTLLLAPASPVGASTVATPTPAPTASTASDGWAVIRLLGPDEEVEAWPAAPPDPAAEAPADQAPADGAAAEDELPDDEPADFEPTEDEPAEEGMRPPSAWALPDAEPAVEPPDGGPEETADEPIEPSAPTDAPHAQPPEAVPTDPHTWTVQPGDHFWSIAERTLATAWGRAPDDAEVAVHWRAVVEANRDRLVVPGHAELILPGQVMVVPPAPPPPA